MSKKSDGFADLVWAAGLLYAGFQIVSAISSYRAGQQGPALYAQRDKRLRDIHSALERIERKLGNG